MSSIPVNLQPRPDDRPPREERWGTGATMSAVAHVVLLAGLVWGVHWKTDSGEAVEAELWAAIPQAAAPPPTDDAVQPPAPQPVQAPPPPPPPPAATQETQRAPDIVTERDREAKEREKQRERDAEKAKQKQLEDQQRKAEELQKQQDKAKSEQQKKADEAKLKKQRDDFLARQFGSIDSPAGATGTAAKSAGPSAGYAARIEARIKPNIVYVREFDASLRAEVTVKLAPDGSIVSRRISQSSGDPAWDKVALDAVDRTAVLPRDVDGTVPSQPFPIGIRPQAH